MKIWIYLNMSVINSVSFAVYLKIGILSTKSNLPVLLSCIF